MHIAQSLAYIKALGYTIEQMQLLEHTPDTWMSWAVRNDGERVFLIVQGTEYVEILERERDQFVQWLTRMQEMM